jgi:4-amino-4-deoxy-L-arabinose transferase-like glycosyltransferase
MWRHFNHRLGHYAVLCVSAWALFFVNLGGAALWDLDEGRNAVAALEMRESGDWIVPKFNNVLRVDKPALLYWLQVAAYGWFGVNEYAARLPSAVAAVIAVLLTYELGRRMFTPAAGLIAGLTLASCPMMCAAARFANPDALLNVFTVLSLFVCWRGFAVNGRWWFVPAGISAGFAVLAKGPVGVLLPGAIVCLFLCWTRQLRRLLDPRLALGVMGFVVVALPWYIWVAADTKAGFLRGFLINHNLDRFLSPLENHRGSPFYYAVVLLAGFAPWSAFLGLTLWYSWSRRRFPESSAPSGDIQQFAQRFLWCWIVVYLVFYSLAATKLPNYVLPVCAPLALLTGSFLQRWRRGEIQPPAWLMAVSLVILALAGLGTALGLSVAGGALRMAFMRERYLAGIAPWAGVGALPVLGAAAAWWCLRREYRTGLVASVTVAAVFFLAPLAAWASMAFNDVKAPQPLVTASGALQRDHDIRIGAYQLEYLPSLNFYCQRNVQHLASQGEIDEFLATPLRVYLFVPAPLWDDLQARIHSPWRVLGTHRDLYRNWDIVVVTNK